MKTFEQFISDVPTNGTVNPLFERGMYSLMTDVERIVNVLRDAHVPFEVVGGVAVTAYILSVDRSRSFVTTEIDVLVNRDDLERIEAVAYPAGYTGRKMMGGFMLIHNGQAPTEAVRLLFTGEKRRSSQPLPNPPIQAEEMHLLQAGITIPVASLNDLVRMELNSFRPRDEAHLDIMNKCGLITPEIEAGLPEELKLRLDQARSRFTEDEFRED